MGALYIVQKSNTALSTTADFLTITAGSTRSLKVREICFEAGGTASSLNILGIYRVGTLGVTPVAQTPTPLNSSASASSFTAATGWTTQPVVGTLIMPISINANGGIFRWVAPPGLEIEIPGGAAAASQLAIGRSISGTGIMTGHVIVEEI